jgi:GT2 family glycosyltransferase
MFFKMPPKILVGCPTSFHKEYALEEYVKAVNSLTYPNFDILLVDNSEDNLYIEKIKKLGLPVIKGPFFESARDRIIASRNILREKVLEENYDYFFSLEQDVLPPPDILQNLLKHSKKLITAIYFAHNVIPDSQTRELIPLVYKLIDKKTLDMRSLSEAELWDNQGLTEVVSAGLGCVLIHRSILEKIKFRYEKNTFDDRWFFIDCHDKKIEVFADTSIKCKHLIHNRPYPWNEIKK